MADDQNRPAQYLYLLWQRHRAVVVIFLVGLLLNGALWIIRSVWYQYSLAIAWFGTLTLLINLVLAWLLVHKEAVFAHALAATAVAVQLLLLVLILRTGASLL